MSTQGRHNFFNHFDHFETEIMNFPLCFYQLNIYYVVYGCNELQSE